MCSDLSFLYCYKIKRAGASIKMFPPLLYLILLFGLLLCFPLGVFPLPVLTLKKRLYLREQDTGKSLYGPQFSGTGFGFGKQSSLHTPYQERPSSATTPLLRYGRHPARVSDIPRGKSEWTALFHPMRISQWPKTVCAAVLPTTTGDAGKKDFHPPFPTHLCPQVSCRLRRQCVHTPKAVRPLYAWYDKALLRHLWRGFS